MIPLSVISSMSLGAIKNILDKKLVLAALSPAKIHTNFCVIKGYNFKKGLNYITFEK